MFGTINAWCLTDFVSATNCFCFSLSVHLIQSLLVAGNFAVLALEALGAEICHSILLNEVVTSAATAELLAVQSGLNDWGMWLASLAFVAC